jgi:hypothetical protein
MDKTKNKIIIEKIKYAPTSPNRSVCASPPYGGSGYVKMQSGLRPLCIFTPPHFLCAGIASQFFYRAQKTSHTAETLSETNANWFIFIIFLTSKYA